MDIEMLMTAYHRNDSKNHDHYVTFGRYEELQGVPPRNQIYVTIGVREGDTMATVDIPLSDLEQVYRTIESTRGY